MSENRKITLIKSNFQNDLIIKTVLTTFITLNVILTIAYMMTSSLFSNPFAIQTFMQYLAGLELFFGAVIYFIGRRISFHIAGPVFALERSLKLMHDGDLTVNLKLRKGDNFKEVSDALNDTIVTYREQLQALKEIINEIKIKTDNQQVTSAEFDALDEKLSFFKIEKEQTRD